MSDSIEILIQGRVFYYAREGFFRSMQNAASDGLKKFPGDPVYKFYYGTSLVLEGRIQEGIRELEPLQSNRDVVLGTCLALVHAHKKCKTVDKEAVIQLDAKLKENRKQANEKSLFYAGVLLYFVCRYDKAKEYIDRLLKIASTSREGLILKGWLELNSLGKDVGKAASQFFETAASTDPECLFGKAKCFEKTGNLSRALDIINQVVVLYPQYTPALLEKMKIQLASQDWELTLDSANRALVQDPVCLEAQRHLLLNALCHEGDYSKGSSLLGDLLRCVDKHEPKNAPLYFETAQVFARVCGRRSVILQQTFIYCEKAVALDQTNPEYVTELGYQSMLQGKMRDAIKYYHSATKLDESYMPALMGVITCQLYDNQYEVAGQQLELLKEIHRSSGMTPELLFLCGMHAQKQGRRTDEVLGYLNECVDAHFAPLEAYPLSLKHFLLMNPDFLLVICRLYLQYVPDQPVSTGQPLPPALKRCQTILQPVTRACPGLLEATYFMAQLKYLAGDIQAAEGLLQRCLNQEESFADARLLLAQILLHQGKIQSASQALEVALSFSFEVRDKLKFHLVKARIQKEEGQLEDAIKTLKTGMSIAGLKLASGSTKKSRQEISTNDKVSLYLELADVHRKMNAQHEAAKIMEDALREFKDTPEEVRIIVSNADLSLARGDAEQALSMLRNIGPEQAYYLQAREKMADIYLNHRKDKRLYASCYREVVEKYPTAQSYLLLGDAYMSIQEPERAIEVYEQAMKKNPRDTVLARKIGQALIKIHNFDKAVTYYRTATKSGAVMELRYDLAELLFRMKRYREADEVIANALQVDTQDNELTKLQWEAKFLSLQSQVNLKVDGEHQALQTLQKARDVQSRVMRRVAVEQPDAVGEQKKLAVSICRLLSERMELKRDLVSASQFYREALVYDENNPDILLALAKLEMAGNKLETARQYCTTILKIDKENDAAILMMADIMFRKNDLEAALVHFQQLFDRKPDYYPAMARYIEAIRRVGKLEEKPKFLDRNDLKIMEPGFYYCRGLFEWYTGDINSAMKSFNRCRNDSEWGLMASYHMIEMCINPDNETIGGESFESSDDWRQTEQIDSQESAIRTAEKLLQDIQDRADEFDYRLMYNFILLARKYRSEAEAALQDFLQLATHDRYRDHIGVILGMATAYMILKNVPKARNQLKRVAKTVWNFGDAEYLERCWLLLSDIYVQSGKYDLATDLLRRVLQYNKSCTKAYEYLGLIMEKEQAFHDAAINYESAWKQSNKANPVIGYKLAFNYMKAKRFVDAIDVCHDVLNKYPAYPKIRKDILDKSRSNLRI